MGSPTRTRARKAAQAEAKTEQYTEEEANAAAAQENAEFQQAQNQYLQSRVATLRIHLNRANARIAELEHNAEQPRED